jgi:hypothetical protein
MRGDNLVCLELVSLSLSLSLSLPRNSVDWLASNSSHLSLVLDLFLPLYALQIMSLKFLHHTCTKIFTSPSLSGLCYLFIPLLPSLLIYGYFTVSIFCPLPSPYLLSKNLLNTPSKSSSSVTAL